MLVRVLAAGVNNTDINTRIGWYAADVVTAIGRRRRPGAPSARSRRHRLVGRRSDFPRIQGADACGHVVDVGSRCRASRGRGADHRRAGVPNPPIAVAEPVYFGSEVDGAFADYTVVPSRHAVPVDVPPERRRVGIVPVHYSAAENMIGRAYVLDGSEGVVTGPPVVSVRRHSTRSRARSRRHRSRRHRQARRGEHARCDEVAARDSDLRTALGPGAVDAIRCGRRSDLAELLAVLRPGGRYATCGAIAGPMVDLDLRFPLPQRSAPVRLHGARRRRLRRAGSHIEHGDVHASGGGQLSAPDIVAAQQRFLTKQHVGKIVITLE